MKSFGDYITCAKYAHAGETSSKEHIEQERLERDQYIKGKIIFQGLAIEVENAQGTTRSGDGWSNEMDYHYGYIVDHWGRDGDNVDVYVGNYLDSDVVVVVNQNNDDGTFDEHKVMLGFETAEAAREAYYSQYEDGWPEQPMSVTNVDMFKAWLILGNKRKPFFN